MTESSKSAEALYQALMRHFVHQDRLAYMSVPYLAAIQTATLGGSWAVAESHRHLGAVVALLGAVVTFCYLLYVVATLADRDVNLEIMNKLAHELIEHTSARDQQVRMNAWPKGRLLRCPISRVFKCVTIVFLVIDFSMAVSLILGLRR